MRKQKEFIMNFERIHRRVGVGMLGPLPNVRDREVDGLITKLSEVGVEIDINKSEKQIFAGDGVKTVLFEEDSYGKMVSGYILRGDHPETTVEIKLGNYHHRRGKTTNDRGELRRGAPIILEVGVSCKILFTNKYDNPELADKIGEVVKGYYEE